MYCVCLCTSFSQAVSDGGNTSQARSHSSIEEEEWWNKGKRVQQVYGGTEKIDENYTLVF